jgi:chromosome segregation ATPase
MFQEELEKRDKKIIDLQGVISERERDSARLADLLRAEKGRVAELEKSAATLKNEQESLLSNLAEARRRTGEIPGLESKVAEAQSEVTILANKLGLLRKDFDYTTALLRDANHLLADKEAEVVALSEKLDPWAKLVELTASRSRIDQQIAQEIKTLNV